jgi:tripartite-type tricarboxylate transporter receptor subunit TctC
VASGQVTFSVMTVALAASQVQKGVLKALAVVSPRRLPQLPDVPTIVESGIADATYMPTYGIIALTGTPRDVVARLSDAMQKSLASPDVLARLDNESARWSCRPMLRTTTATSPRNRNC